MFYLTAFKKRKMYSPLNCYHDKAQSLVCCGKILHITKNLIKWFYWDCYFRLI